MFGFTWSPENSSLGISAMGPMRANNALMRLWLKLTHRLLDQRLRKMRNKNLREFPLHRTEIMSSFLGPAEILIQSGKIKYKNIDGISTYGQTVFKNLFKNFHSKIDEKWIKNLKFSPLLFFQNSGVEEKWKSMSVREFLSSKIVIRELFRRSLNKCGIFQKKNVNCLTDFLFA